MMTIPLETLLNLVGTLDDSTGPDTPCQRFRRFLKENLTHPGEVKDYVEASLRHKGDQYNRALQDLVNHIGRLLGFTVEFGRYKGVVGESGHDGFWQSPAGYSIVVETKTTDAYVIKTSAILGYINSLIDEKKIPDPAKALGLYVVARPDAELVQLRNAIIAEKRSNLRIISIDSLIQLAEILQEYEVDHNAILTVLRPSEPEVHPIVELMGKLIAGAITPAETPVTTPALETSEPRSEEGEMYVLTPVASDEIATAEEIIKKLLEAGIYAYGDRTPTRKILKPGDWLCFYAKQLGVVAHARVKSAPKREPHKLLRHPEKYPWTFKVDAAKFYFKKPVIIDESLRSRLEVFKGRDPSKSWSWLVQSTRRISRNDFLLLTSQRTEEPHEA